MELVFFGALKNTGKDSEFAKSRLVIQAFNDREKEEILTRAPTIQRVSQRLILAISASKGWEVLTRDVSWAFVQADTTIYRKIFEEALPEMMLEEDDVLQVLKPLYGLPELLSLVL
jgi:hypothetical protein